LATGLFRHLPFHLGLVLAAHWQSG
jgi:hypothetical protein